MARELKVNSRRSIIIPDGVRVYGGEYNVKCRSEFAECKEWYAWMREHHPDWSKSLAHVPNEGHGRLDKISEGLTPGCCDYISPFGYFMEAKRVDISSALRDKKHTQEQIDYLEECAKHGAFACLCFGADAMKQSFEDFLIWRFYLTQKQ